MRTTIPFLDRGSVRRQIMLAVTVGLASVAVLAGLAGSVQGARQMRGLMQAQGERITDNLARQSSLALLVSAPEHAADALKLTLGFPDVVAAEIRDSRGARLAVRGDEQRLQDGDDLAAGEGSPSASAPLAALEAESADAWRFAAPVTIEGQGDSPLDLPTPARRLGEVRVVISKATLKRLQGQVFAVNLGTAGLVALLFLLGMRALTARLMRPLAALSHAMARAEAGDALVQADESCGARDIVDMAHAFNSMVAALREREERFRSLATLSSDWYWERDEHDRLTLLSSGFAEVTGLDPQQMLGKRRGEIDRFEFPPDAWVGVRDRIAAREPFHDLPWRFVRADGQVRHGVTSGEPVFERDGRFRGYRGVSKDTTALKLAESAQQSAQRLRRLVEHLPAGAIYVEDGGLLPNRAAEHITGYERGQIAGLDEWFDKLFGAEAAAVRRAYETDRTAQFPVPRELVVVHADGSRRDVEFAAWRDEQSEVWLLHDITQRKTAQRELEAALREQQVIFDNASVTIALVRDRVIQRCNRGMEKMFGYEPGELVGMPTRRLHADEGEYERSGSEAYAAIAAGRTWSDESCMVRKDGSIVWAVIRGQAVDPADPAQGVIFVASDVTERRRYEAALAAANERLARGLADLERTQRELSMLGELSGYLQACPSAQEAVAALAEYAPRLFSGGAGALYLLDDGQARTLREDLRWGDGFEPASSFSADDCWALRRAQPWRLDQPDGVRCCVHLGSRRPGAYACLPLMAQGKIFGLLHVQHAGAATAEQAEARHRLALALADQAGLALANIRLRETLHQQSIRDALTGLYNRRYMNEAIAREMARAQRHHTSLALLIVDVDHFKRFNDTFGHEAGDVVLRHLARVLERHVRSTDVACRLGGEEFVLLLPEVDAEQATRRALQLLDAVRALELAHGGQVLGRVTASIGLALYPQHAASASALVEAADAALYRAKAAGRDRLVHCGTAAEEAG